MQLKLFIINTSKPELHTQRIVVLKIQTHNAKHQLLSVEIFIIMNNINIIEINCFINWHNFTTFESALPAHEFSLL